MAVTWKSALHVITQLAPTIGAALATPLAATAITVLEQALGVAVAGSTSERQDAIASAIENATPEQLIAIRTADQDYQSRMAELGFKSAADLAALANADRSSARQMAITGVKNSTPMILSYLIVGAFVFAALAVLFHKAAADSVIAGTVFGYLASKAERPLSFWLGGSAESQHANELLAASTPVAAPAAGGSFKS